MHLKTHLAPSLEGAKVKCASVLSALRVAVTLGAPTPLIMWGMANAAPDFSPGYPSGGEMISKAWQSGWDYLADGPAPRPDVTRHMMRASKCQQRTAEELLRKAAMLGHLKVVGRGRLQVPTLARP